MLPLADCDRPDRCDCRYVRFADRRGGPRRRSEGALPKSSMGLRWLSGAKTKADARTSSATGENRRHG